MSGGQARRFEAFPACVSHRAAEGDAVTEDDSAVRRGSRVTTGYSCEVRKYETAVINHSDNISASNTVSLSLTADQL